MSSEILINYPEVYHRTAQLRSRIVSELQTMENEYSLIIASISDLDSTTNYMLELAMESNKKKAIAVMETLDKLLSSISNSAMQIEIHEQQKASIFSGVSRFISAVETIGNSIRRGR